MRRPLTYLSAAALCLATAVLCISACSKTDPMFDGPSGSNPSGMVNRRESAQTRHVFLLYFAGFNSLYEYMYNESGVSSLSGDYQDLLKGYIPANRGLATDDILLTYTQFPGKARDYSGELRSHLVRLSRNLAGQTVRDTLKSYGPEYISADSNTLRTVLSDVKQLFPAKDYGLLFSSHATGWLPAGHTTSLETESRAGSGNGSGEEDGGAEAIGDGDGSGNGSDEEEAEEPAIRQNSVGQTQTGTPGSYKCYEIDLKNFAAAIPMKLDYILFDTCLMGGIEVAYQLRNVCKRIGFSSAEILAEGFDYRNLCRHIFNEEDHGITGICYDFFAQYQAPGQQFPYCTVSAVDCSGLENLAQVCKDIFAANRAGLAAINPAQVQGYFQYGWHWFYDLEDILVQAGTSEKELADFRDALKDCVLCNYATPKFITITIRTHCGLSMYLPCNGEAKLDTYYRTLDWNLATGLVDDGTDTGLAE